MGRKGLICWECHKPTLVKDIGEERSRYPGRVQEVLCKTCQQARIAATVKETRRRIGLDP